MRPASWWCRPRWPVLLSKVSASSDVASWLSDRRAQRSRARRSGGLLRQHADTAGRRGRGSQLHRTAGPGPGTRSLEAFEHQDVPFEVLVERLNPIAQPDASPAGPGDAGLAELRRQRRYRPSGPGLPGLEATSIPLDTQAARMDLTFSLAERWTEAGASDGIGGQVEFRTDVFDAASVDDPCRAPGANPAGAHRLIPTRRLSAAGPAGSCGARTPGGPRQPGGIGGGGHPGLDSGAVRRPGGAHTRCGGADLRSALVDVHGSSTRPPTSWRSNLAGRRRGSGTRLWRCCFRGPPRPSSRWSRCSRPGPRIYRSIRRCRPRGSVSCSTDAAPDRRSQHRRTRPNGFAEFDVPVLEVSRRHRRHRPRRSRCPRRRPTTSPT